MVNLLQSLAVLESPSQAAAAQQPVFDVLADQLRPLGFAVRRWHGRETGGVLLARPVERLHGGPHSYCWAIATRCGRWVPGQDAGAARR